eukprot:gene13250-15267_t
MKAPKLRTKISCHHPDHNMRRFCSLYPVGLHDNLRKSYQLAWPYHHPPYLPPTNCGYYIRRMSDMKEQKGKEKELDDFKTRCNKIDFDSLAKTVEEQEKAIVNLKTVTLINYEYYIRSICGEYLLFAVGNQPKKGQEDSAFFDQDSLPLHLQSRRIRMKVPTILSLMPFLPEDDKEAKVLLDTKITNRNKTVHFGSAAMLKRRIEECLATFEMFPELKEDGRLGMEYNILLTYDALRAANIF